MTMYKLAITVMYFALIAFFMGVFITLGKKIIEKIWSEKPMVIVHKIDKKKMQ